MKKTSIFKLSFMLILCFVFNAHNVSSQNYPTILIDGDSILLSDVSNSKFPFWLDAGKTLDLGVNTKFISVLEFKEVTASSGDINLVYNKVLIIDAQQTVPNGYVWKVEYVGLATSAYVNPSGSFAPTPPSVIISASPAGNICLNSNVTFTATAYNAGSSPSYQWLLNGFAVGTNSPTYSNSTLSHGDKVKCEIQVGGVSVSSNELTMFVVQPTTIADAGSDQALCNPSTITLAGNSPATTELGTWSIYSGNQNISITNANLPNTTITGFTSFPDTVVLRWTISNPPCSDTYDDVMISVGEQPTTANAGSDINPACGVTTATLAANTPTVGIGSWSVVSGSATITNPSSPTSGVTGLAIPGTATLRWTISNPPCAASTDDVVITTTSCFTCGIDNLVDSRDANTYQTVQIGTQCWMKENLKYLPIVHNDTEFASQGTISAKGYGVLGYDGDDVIIAKAQSYYNSYGALYNWYAAMDGYLSSNSNPSGVKGICPIGWHLPSDDEWKQLEMFLGMSQVEADATDYRGIDQGAKLKSTSGWLNNGNGTDNYGFTALPGGYRHAFGTSDSPLHHGTWWSATDDGANAWRRYLIYVYNNVLRTATDKCRGYSVRCLKD